MPGLTQTMTFRLFDSMPQAVLEQWREELRRLPEKEADIERRKRIDAYLDQGHGSCYLRETIGWRKSSRTRCCIMTASDI